MAKTIPVYFNDSDEKQFLPKIQEIAKPIRGTESQIIMSIIERWFKGESIEDNKN